MQWIWHCTVISCHINLNTLSLVLKILYSQKTHKRSSSIEFLAGAKKVSVNCYTDSVRWTFGGAEVQNAGNCSSLLAVFHHHFHCELIELLKVVWTFFQTNCLKKTKAKARDCNWHSEKCIVTGVSTFSVVYRGTLINYSGLYTVFTVGVWKQSF